jgi:hypothetical protein
VVRDELQLVCVVPLSDPQHVLSWLQLGPSGQAVGLYEPKVGMYCAQ